MGGPTAAGAGSLDGEPNASGFDSANNAGISTQKNRGDRWVQLTGRSRVIHALWNGFLSVDVEPGAGCATGSACVWPSGWALGVAWVQAAGSGSAVGAS